MEIPKCFLVHQVLKVSVRFFAVLSEIEGTGIVVDQRGCDQDYVGKQVSVSQNGL